MISIHLLLGHELGHAFGLPHIGPLQNDKLGNSLMGPVNMVYSRRKGPDDRRVYLSQASAAMPRQRAWS